MRRASFWLVNKALVPWTTFSPIVFVFISLYFPYFHWISFLSCIHFFVIIWKPGCGCRWSRGKGGDGGDSRERDQQFFVLFLFLFQLSFLLYEQALLPVPRQRVASTSGCHWRKLMSVARSLQCNSATLFHFRYQFGVGREQWRIKVENKREINRNHNKGDDNVRDNDMCVMNNNNNKNYYYNYL